MIKIITIRRQQDCEYESIANNLANVDDRYYIYYIL